MIEIMNAVARLWWEWMVALGWQIALLVGIIGGLDLLIRKWAWPQLRYALWSLVLLKLLLPPGLSLPSGVVNGLSPAVNEAVACLPWEKPAAAIADVPQRAALLSEVGHQYTNNTYVTPPMTAVAVDANPQPAIIDPQLDGRVYVMGMWLLGATVLGVFLAVRLRALSKGCDETCEAAPVPESFYNRMRQCADRVGLRRLPRVVPTTRLANPAVFGMFRPILLLPVGYLSRLSRRDTEHVLLHEFCHIKRGDLCVHGLTLALQIVFWFNPLLWLVRRHTRHLRELCCDASVANLLREDTPAYRETLLETARRLLASHAEPGLGLLGLFEDANCLLTRLHWLQKPTWRYRKMKSLMVVIVAGFMAACVLPMAQAQPDATVQEHEYAAQVHDTQASQEMQDLQKQMRQLQEQMQQLAKRMAELNVARTELARRAAAGTGLFESYTVREGDTLAKIAEKIAGSDKGKIERAIARIKEANELTADRLQVGQKLWVPARSDRPEASVDLPPEIPAVHAIPPISHEAKTPAMPALPAAPHAPQPRVHTNDNRASVELEPQRSVTHLKAGTRVLVENEIGSVKIRTGDEQSCVVVTTVKGWGDTEEQAAEMAKQVEWRITPEDGVLRIKASLSDEARKGDRGGAEVRYEITVPRQTPVEVVQKVGGVKLSGLTGGAQAKVEAGSISAEGLAGDVDLTTRAGSIDVSVPAAASVQINATTKLGSIKNDLPLDVRSQAILRQGHVQHTLGSSAVGTLGSGRDKLNLQVEVGSIKITSPAARPDEEHPSSF